MPANLKQSHFENKPHIVAQTKQLIEKPNANAYELSMPLIMAAYLGDDDLYASAYSKMQDEMDKNHFPSWVNDQNRAGIKAWMYGRVLQSANMMGTAEQAQKAHLDLKSNLSDESTSFNAWAWGYLAAASDVDYQESQRKMKIEAENMVKQGDLCNALWACIMALPAAAKANDKETYQFSLNLIKQVIGASNNDDATFAQKLYYKFPVNDYRAWGLGIMRLSAAMMGDEAMFSLLGEHVANAIKTTEAPLQDQLLAQVNDELAKACFVELSSKNKIKTSNQ
jgi:hypothetical protein